MFCYKCGVQLPDESAYCTKCGAKLPVTNDAATAPGPGASPMAIGTPAAKEPEEEVWRGSFSGKALAHYWLLYGLCAILLLYILIAVLPVRESWHGWLYFGLFTGWPLWICGETLYNKWSIRYRLTNYRFFRDTGILSRKKSELELVRVDDVEVRQNFLQRIFGVGTVLIISTDATDPRIELDGIDDPTKVKEKIRELVRKRRSGSLNVESL